jgi:hypothetical protein
MITKQCQMNKIKLQIILEPTVFHVYFYVSKTLVWNTDPWRLPSDFLIHILTLLCNHWQFSPLLYRSGSVIVNSAESSTPGHKYM